MITEKINLIKNKVESEIAINLKWGVFIVTNVRTDLALEAKEIYQEKHRKEKDIDYFIYIHNYFFRYIF